ncbi:hypothetical protein U2F10_24250 [Leptothoe sp. EHU-05/26/07-4]
MGQRYQTNPVTVSQSGKAAISILESVQASKVFDLDNGQLIKHNAQSIWAGALTPHRFDHLEQLLPYLNGDYSFVLGVDRSGDCDRKFITTAERVQRLGVEKQQNWIYRSKEDLIFQYGRMPIIIDIDPGNFEYEEAYQAIRGVFPGWDDTQRIEKPSTSSGICNADGDVVYDSNGSHLLILVDGLNSVEDYQRFQENLEARFWLAGFGHWMLSKKPSDGGPRRALERFPMDMAVLKDPARVIYSQGATFTKKAKRAGFWQRPLNPQFFEGREAFNAADFEIDDLDRLEAMKLRSEAKEKLLKEYLPQRTKELISIGVSPSKAKERAADETRSIENQELPGSTLLYPADGSDPVRADSLLPEHDGLLLKAVLEPEYRGGAQTAIAYVNGNGIVIRDQAHGGCKYLVQLAEKHGNILRQLASQWAKLKEYAHVTRTSVDIVPVTPMEKGAIGEYEAQVGINKARSHLAKAWREQHLLSNGEVGWVEPVSLPADSRSLTAFSADVSLGKTSNGVSRGVFENYQRGGRTLIVTALRHLNADTRRQYQPHDGHGRPSEFQRLLQETGIAAPTVMILGEESSSSPQDVQPLSLDPWCADIVICCPESLWKIAKDIQSHGTEYNLITIDEVSSSVHRMVSGALNANAMEMKRTLCDLLEYSQHVIIGQQEIEQFTLKQIQTWGNFSDAETTVQIRQVHPNPDCEHWGFDREIDILYAIQQSVSMGENVAIATADKTAGRKLCELLGDKAEVFDAWHDKDFDGARAKAFRNDPNAFIRNHQPQVLSFSPTMSHGFSITENHFDRVFYLPNVWTTDSDIQQQIARIRDVFRGNRLKSVGTYLKGKPGLGYWPDANELSMVQALEDVKDSFLGAYRQKWVNSHRGHEAVLERAQEQCDELADSIAPHLQAQRFRQVFEKELWALSVERNGWTDQNADPKFTFQYDGDGSLRKEFEQKLEAARIRYEVKLSDMASKVEAIDLKGHEPKSMDDILGDMKFKRTQKIGSDDLNTSDYWRLFRFGVNAREAWRTVLFMGLYRLYKERPDLWKRLVAQRTERKILIEELRAADLLQIDEIPPLAEIETLIDAFMLVLSCAAVRELLSREKPIASNDPLLGQIKQYVLANRQAYYRLMKSRPTEKRCATQLVSTLLKRFGLHWNTVSRSGTKVRVRKYEIQGHLKYLEKRLSDQEKRKEPNQEVIERLEGWLEFIPRLVEARFQRLVAGIVELDNLLTLMSDWSGPPLTS